MKYSGFIFWLSELIICREAASRHQRTASPSQKPTSTSNTTVSQAVFIQEQLYPGSAGTSFPSSKQHPRGQRSICPYCFSYHVLALTCLRAPQRPQTLHEPSTSSRKRKRGQEEQAGHPSFFRTLEQAPSKRLRTSPACDISEASIDPLQHWVQTGKWRKEYFEQDSQVREYFERGKLTKELGQRDWLREHYTREPFRAMHPFTHLHHLFARKKSSSSLSRKKSQSSLQTPSDQLPREVKSAYYRNPDYAIELEDEGSYMREFDDDDDDIPKNARDLCRTLLETEQMVPQDSLFRDDLFKKTCRKIQDRNETMVIRDIGLLIVPSAQTLATYGATHLNHLYETTNEGWNSVFSFPLNKTRPQPDFSVGFGRSAFTQEQLNKLKPFVGEPGSKVITYFMATTRHLRGEVRRCRSRYCRSPECS